jgi:hypothetical protein
VFADDELDRVDELRVVWSSRDESRKSTFAAIGPRCRWSVVLAVCRDRPLDLVSRIRRLTRIVAHGLDVFLQFLP